MITATSLIRVFIVHMNEITSVSISSSAHRRVTKFYVYSELRDRVTLQHLEVCLQETQIYVPSQQWYFHLILNQQRLSPKKYTQAYHTMAN